MNKKIEEEGASESENNSNNLYRVRRFAFVRLKGRLCFPVESCGTNFVANAIVFFLVAAFNIPSFNVFSAPIASPRL